jgi:protein phosphatase
VDRGSKSVETILLLFSLKIKYPENVFLLRGAHEDRQVNKFMGFGDECALKFKENIDDQFSFFSRANKLFDKLPVAALLEDTIFCAHGGIGHTIKSVYELDKLDKPYKVNHDPKTRMDKIVYDLLWSDPCRPGEQEFAPNYEHDYFRAKGVPMS